MSQDDLKRVIETIKLRVPIEDLVRDRVPALKKQGALWVACCPFHDERTPSFKVDPRRGSWHCFGACATGGDQISFLQRLDHLEFMEALEILAARVGVELPRRGRGRDEATDLDPLTTALDRSAEFYRRQLASREGRIARNYLEERGITANTIEAFGLGYAPSTGQALVGFARALVRDGELPTTGAFTRAALVRVGDSGRPFDFFRGRLMIPIRDAKGRTVGFGARRLLDDADTPAGAGPKYINSPETPAFHKGRVIYGLDRAIADVRRSGHLILVEGYTDVIAAHQAGLSTVAAVLGTSTTEDHAGHSLFEDGCVTCHFDYAGQGEPMHDFEPRTDTCARCHGGLDTFDRPAYGDYDGNGTTQGIQTEVSGLLDVLVQGMLIDPQMTFVNGRFEYGESTDGSMTGASEDQKRAAFNYYSVVGDASRGIHNAARTVQLLQRSYESVTGVPVPGADLR